MWVQGDSVSLSVHWMVHAATCKSRLLSDFVMRACSCIGGSKQTVHDADRVLEASHIMHLQHRHPNVASYTETMLQPASQMVVMEPDMQQQQAEHDQTALHLIFGKQTGAHG